MITPHGFQVRVLVPIYQFGNIVSHFFGFLLQIADVRVSELVVFLITELSSGVPIARELKGSGVPTAGNYT